MVRLHSTTQVHILENFKLLVTRAYPKDKKNCLLSNKRNTLSGYRDHPNLDLNLKTHCASREKLDSLKPIKITELLGSRRILAGRRSKILFRLESIRML